MTRLRSRTLAVLIATGLLSPVVSAARTLTLRPQTSPAAGEAADFRPQPFPHLLQVGQVREGVGRGNGRVSTVTGRPTVLRREPFLLSDLGEDPISALRKMKAEAEAETIRIVALRVDFLLDSAGDASTGDGRFDLRSADSAQVAIDPPPHDKAYFESHLEAVRRYYDVQVGGSLVLEYDVFPADPDSAYHLSDTARYGPWIFSVSSDSILARAERFVRESVMLADSLDKSIDWKRYQSFLVFHAGADFQGDIRRDTNYDIPSFNLFLGDSLEVVVGGPDSVAVNLVMVVPETVSQDEFLGALNGVIAHEFGHQMSFFDLYDVYTGLPVVGVYSLMDSGDGQFGTIPDPYHEGEFVAVRGVLPASLDPWHKLIFFPEATNLHRAVDGAETDLPAVLLESDILYVPIHDYLDFGIPSEYFLAETRPIDYNGDDQVILRADPTTGVILGPEPAEGNPQDTLAYLEYDYLLPGGGILLWHVDEIAAIEGLVTFGGVNIYSDRRGVDLEEADGIQDIGTASPEFLGGPHDPFFVGGYTRFGPDTVPDSRTNDGTETGITLEILDPPGTSMRVTAGVPLALAGWPVAFLGSMPPDGLNRVDLGADGIDDLLFALGPALVGVTPDGEGFADGGERFTFAVLSDTLEQGPVVSLAPAGFPTFETPVVAVRAAGRVSWFDVWSDPLGEWPTGHDPTRVSAGPVPLPADGLWLVGTSDGRVLALRPDEGGTIDASVLIEESTADSIVALAAGRVGPYAPLWVAYGTAEGWVDLREFETPASAPVRTGRWKEGSGPIRSLLALEAPVHLGEDPTDLLLVATEDRLVDLRGFDGEPRPGWPKVVGDTLAGTPAVGDPDGDGLLEVVATTRSGEISLWELAGTVAPHWPRSVWHPDQSRRTDCTTGPRLWDVGGDGTIEIVQLRGDGILVVIDEGGRPMPGWPHAAGAPAAEGPVRLIGPDGGERWYIATVLADTVTALTVRPLPAGEIVYEDRPGCFPSPGGGPARAGIYPLQMVPTPLAAETFFDPRDLILHPNPVRGNELKLRYVLGSQARIVAALFDVSGRQRAQREWQGHAGAGGETYLWDLGEVASGAYIVRLQIEGDGRRRTVIRPIAVVR